MPNYYLDIETTGLDPKAEKILTIQFMKLDALTAKPLEELTVLKEWESSEKEIILEFIRRTRITSENVFSFVPVGYNLGFEHNFFIERCRVHGLETVDILNRPFIDLRSCGVIMNKGAFIGSGLDKLTGKPHDGRLIPVWYSNSEYPKILDYVKKESEEFVKFCAWLYMELPPILAKFKTACSENPK